jgi:exodeoxyribonuclease VII small subunit
MCTGDNSATPIDKLSEDVKIGARLIKELDSKLKQVETEVRDAFKELDEKDNPLQEK